MKYPSLMMVLVCCARIAMWCFHYIVQVWSEQGDDVCGRLENEVVYVMESPLPTKRSTTPKTRPSPFLEPARRGGKRRYRAHARRCTHAFDPPQAHHCGYSCCLKAANRRPTKANIKRLRKMTASLFESYYWNGKSVLGMNLDDLISEHDSIQTYLDAMRGTQWASRYELYLALQVLGTSAYIDDGDAMYQIGHNPSKIIACNNSHYTLRHVRG